MKTRARPRHDVACRVELRVGAQVVAGDVVLHRAHHGVDRLEDAVLELARLAGLRGIAQKTELRIISGGSTGFRMMIALPRSAPPTTSTAAAVVSVNSSMLARVPGPADWLEIGGDDLGVRDRDDATRPR